MKKVDLSLLDFILVMSPIVLLFVCSCWRYAPVNELKLAEYQTTLTIKLNREIVLPLSIADFASIGGHAWCCLLLGL